MGGLPPLWAISRIGTRSSPTCIFFEAGRGWIAASSTCAVAARNLGWAFMALPSAALPASGSKGLSHPLRPEQDPCEALKVAQDGAEIVFRHEPRAGAHEHGGAADPHLGSARPGSARSALRGAT